MAQKQSVAQPEIGKKQEGLRFVDIHPAGLPKRQTDPKPIHWIDSFDINIRPKENLFTLVGYAVNSASENFERYEICRLMISNSHAANLVDILARLTNHYPEKPEARESDKPITKKRGGKSVLDRHT